MKDITAPLQITLTGAELIDLMHALSAYMRHLEPSRHVPEVGSWIERVDNLHVRVTNALLAK